MLGFLVAVIVLAFGMWREQWWTQREADVLEHIWKIEDTCSGLVMEPSAEVKHLQEALADATEEAAKLQKQAKACKGPVDLGKAQDDLQQSWQPLTAIFETAATRPWDLVTTVFDFTITLFNLSWKFWAIYICLKEYIVALKEGRRDAALMLFPMPALASWVVWPSWWISSSPLCSWIWSQYEILAITELAMLAGLMARPLALALCLQWAVKRDNSELAAKMCRWGADPERKFCGKSALDMARENDRKEILKYLVARQVQAGLQATKAEQRQ